MASLSWAIFGIACLVLGLVLGNIRHLMSRVQELDTQLTELKLLVLEDGRKDGDIFSYEAVRVDTGEATVCKSAGGASSASVPSCQGMIFRNTRFQHPLISVNFSGSQFLSVSFVDGLDAGRSDFKRTVFQDVLQMPSRLSWSSFVGSQFVNVTFKLRRAHHLNMSRATFDNCNFRDLHTSDVDFSNSIFHSPIFDEANCRACDFSRATLENASFVSGDFSQAKFDHALFRRSSTFEGADLFQTSWTKVRWEKRRGHMVYFNHADLGLALDIDDLLDRLNDNE